MIVVRKSVEFDRWLRKLNDDNARARIISRLIRLGEGNAGDAKTVGGGLMELRISYGPGYRVYYKQHGTELVLVLCGGDKTTQQGDIQRARLILAAELERE